MKREREGIWKTTRTPGLAEPSRGRPPRPAPAPPSHGRAAPPRPGNPPPAPARLPTARRRARSAGHRLPPDARPPLFPASGGFHARKGPRPASGDAAGTAASRPPPGRGGPGPPPPGHAVPCSAGRAPPRGSLRPPPRLLTERSESEPGEPGAECAGEQLPSLEWGEAP